MMLEWHRSSSAQVPRKKIYLSSLSQLIEKKVITQPQVSINSKLFPQRTYAKKLSLNHQRAKSNVQLRTHKFDLHWTSKQTKYMVVENNRSPSAQPHSRSARLNTMDFKAQLRSTQLNPRAVLMPTSVRPLTQSAHCFHQRQNSMKEKTQERPNSPQKNFLRKGSSLQKQIVVNLLRNKLVREKELNEKKQYSNKDILKMIQVFKGVTLHEGKGKKGVLVEEPVVEKSRKTSSHHMKELKGWENQMPQLQQLHDFSRVEVNDNAEEESKVN